SASVRRLEAFYVGPANERELRAAIVDAVGSEPDVLLVPLPYFYYPGMRIELDATCDADDRLLFRTADGDDLQAALAALELAPSGRRWRRPTRRAPRSARDGSTAARARGRSPTPSRCRRCRAASASPRSRPTCRRRTSSSSAAACRSTSAGRFSTPATSRPRP